MMPMMPLRKHQSSAEKLSRLLRRLSPAFCRTRAGTGRQQRGLRQTAVVFAAMMCPREGLPRVLSLRFPSLLLLRYAPLGLGSLVCSGLLPMCLCSYNGFYNSISRSNDAH